MTHYRTADEWIATLTLAPHPEGGYYREMYRSPGTISAQALPGHRGGERAFATSIYFLLKSGERSHYHRLRSDELWYFHAGAPLVRSVIGPSGGRTRRRMGFDAAAGEALQCVVPADHWFGAEVDEPDSFSLISCVVSPGFDFADFELGTRAGLLEQFPQHAASIEALTLP